MMYSISIFTLFRIPLSLVLFFSFFCALPLAAQENEDLDAVSYDIRIENIDMATQFITANTTLKLAVLSDDLTQAILDFKYFEIDSITIDGEMISSFTQDDDLLTIDLPAAANTGDTLDVSVHYNGTPYHEDWGGFHFSGDYAFNLGVGLNDIPHNLGKSWFPCIDNFTDRAIYHIYGTVDNSMMVVSGGLLIEQIDNGNGTTTYHWHTAHSLPTYLVSVAIGDYVAVSDTYNGIEADIPIDIYVRPQDTIKVAGTFVNLKTILAQFEDRMGPYPWERVGYVSTALGAMEHATNIAVPHFTISGNTSYESLMAHELTHMWLGDQVTCSSAEEMWLNEGWATFFQMYYAIELYGYDFFKEEMRDVHREVLQYCHTPGGDGDYFVLNDIPQTHTYGMTAYDKGSTVVQAMRFYLGDSLFFDGLRAYTDEFAYNSASSYDMRDFFTTRTGVDMTGFFDNWVFNAGTPHYSLDYFETAPAGPNYESTVFLRNKRKGPLFTGNDHIVEITFMSDTWEAQTERVSFSGETGEEIFTTPFEPSSVFIDLEEKMCDATTDHYKIIDETGSYTYSKTFLEIEVLDITDSAFVQVTHNWAPPDSLEEPVNGLTLSDYRYWTVSGILPETFEAKGYFFYTINSYLDNTLITGPTDSVVVMYRASAQEEWQDVEFEQLGNWTVGNIIVQDLEMGDYALAVWDTQVGISEENKTTGKIEIYPNPAGDKIKIGLPEYNTNGEISIYDSNGRLIDRFAVDPDQGPLEYSTVNLAPGTYLLKFAGKGNDFAAAHKFIVD